MDDEQPRWKRFQKLSFNSKDLSKRARRAEVSTMRHARKFVSRRMSNIYDVRRHVALWLIGVALLIVIVGVQQMWFRAGYMDDAPVDGGTYAEGVLGQINTLNPLYATTAPEQAVSRLVFSSLLQYDTSGTLGNDIASGYSVEEQGKRYVVTIRKGVKWHDGTVLTAKDVLFTVNLMKNTEARTAYEPQWRGVTATQRGDDQIEFSLPSTYAAFPHILTFPILPEHILREVAPAQLRESAFSLQPIGTGPFEFRLNQPESNRRIINLTAFEDYFKGTPRLARFELHAYTDRDDIKKALEIGQVIATGELSSSDELTGASRFATTTTTLNAGVFAFFNTQQPALKDVAVRRALSSALDTAQLRKQVGAEFSLDGPFASQQVPGVAEAVTHSYNLDSARKQLDDAGWKLEGDVRKKDGQPLELAMVTTNDPQYEKAANIVADDWKQIGVTVRLSVIDPNDPTKNFTQNILQPRAYDVLIYEVSIGADPDVYAFWHSSQAGSQGLNLSLYSSGLSDDALSSARARVEPELRNAKYLAFAKQWASDVPAVGLFQSQMAYKSYDQVTALTKQQKIVTPADRYANVIDWTAERGQVYKTP